MHRVEISRERESHNVTKSMLRELKQKIADAETETSTAVQAREAASTEVASLRAEIEVEKQEHKSSKNIISELKSALTESQRRHSSSEAKFQAELENLREGLVVEHNAILKKTVEEERSVQHKSAAKKVALARATWIKNMEKAAFGKAGLALFCFNIFNIQVCKRARDGCL